MPKVVILVGLPGMGKSFYAKKRQEAHPEEDWWIVSSDYFIEKKAQEEGLTYNEVFKKYIKDATGHFWYKVKKFSREGKNIIIDRTNMNKASRQKIRDAMKGCGHEYEIEYVVVDSVSAITFFRQLSNREGKKISSHVLEEMANRFEPIEEHEYSF